MCADKARAVSYRHTANFGLLKIPLPACRRTVEISREVPDTVFSSFRWRYPGDLPDFALRTPFTSSVYRLGSEQAGPEEQAFQ